jgi:hypothetical protein
MELRLLHGLRSGKLRIPTIAILAVLHIAATSACERHARVPASDYGDVEQDVQDEWEIETNDAVYRVNWFTTTDSTIVILDAQWKQFKSSYARYPVNSVTRVANPEVPIVLLRKDVVSVSRVEFSEGRTALAVGGTAIVIAAAAVFVFLLLAFKNMPSD